MVSAAQAWHCQWNLLSPPRNTHVERVSSRGDYYWAVPCQGSHRGGPETQGFSPRGQRGITHTKESSAQQWALCGDGAQSCRCDQEWTLCGNSAQSCRCDQEYLRMTECSSHGSCSVSSASEPCLRHPLEKEEVWPK